MNELKTLEERLKSATDRISAAIFAQQGQNSQLIATRQTNAALREELQDIKAKREEDLAEINGLIEQVRPLLEGAEDA